MKLLKSSLKRDSFRSMSHIACEALKSSFECARFQELGTTPLKEMDGGLPPKLCNAIWESLDRLFPRKHERVMGREHQEELRCILKLMFNEQSFRRTMSRVKQTFGCGSSWCAKDLDRHFLCLFYLFDPRISHLVNLHLMIVFKTLEALTVIIYVGEPNRRMLWQPTFPPLLAYFFGGSLSCFSHLDLETRIFLRKNWSSSAPK